MDFSITSVETIPNLNCLAAFTPKTTEVFKETEDTAPVPINDKMQYMPWGHDNNMPYDILELIESDETLSTCQQFNAEMCYGAGIQYVTESATAQVKQEVDDFLLDNDLTTYFFGVSQDFKHFGFCISVIIPNREGKKIVRLQRKEACFVALPPPMAAAKSTISSMPTGAEYPPKIKLRKSKHRDAKLVTTKPKSTPSTHHLTTITQIVP